MATTTTEQYGNSSDALRTVGRDQMRLAIPRMQRRVRSKIACRSVRTLSDERVQALTMGTLSTYQVDVAYLSEVRMPGAGQTSIKVPGTDTSYHLFHNGVADNAGRHGVAVALNLVAYVALLAHLHFRSSVPNLPERVYRQPACLSGLRSDS